MKYEKEYIQTVKDAKETIHGFKKKAYYQDILNLFLLFSNYMGDGFSQSHFRFLLMDNHGLKETRKMVEFCKQRKFLFKSFPKSDIITAKDLVPHLKYLRKGNIKNEDDLDKYLKHLRKKNIIKATNRKHPLKYKLTTEAIWGHHLTRVENYLEQWEPGLLRLPIFTPNEKRYEDLFLYVLPFGFDFTREENNEINKCFDEVRKILWRIVKIKNRKIQHLLEGKNEEERMKLAAVDFFYHGTNF